MYFIGKTTYVVFMFDFDIILNIVIGHGQSIVGGNPLVSFKKSDRPWLKPALLWAIPILVTSMLWISIITF